VGDRTRRYRWPLAALVAAVALGAALLAGAREGREDATVSAPATRADPVPYDGRSPVLPEGGDEQRVLVALPRPALGELGPLDPEAQRAYVRSLEREGAALRSGLQARGVALRDAVALSRTYNGFAATVRARDLARLPRLGVRTEPQRRFYPATAAAEPAAAPAPAAPPAPPAGQPAIALLDTGVELGDPALRGFVAGGGRDVVDADDDPSAGRDPRDPRRREQHGGALAAVLAAAGERVRPIRVAGLQPLPESGATEEYATTEQLLAGLERAVDADGDGAADDHADVALVGVNAPYAGFASSPEARAARAAARLGTLVVAPAGNEGRGRGGAGTVGSPAAAPAVLAAGAVPGGGPGLRRLTLSLPGRGLRVGDVALLAGGAAPRRLRVGGRLPPPGAPVALDPRGRSALSGRLVVVRAGAGAGGAGDAAAPAAAAGAAAVVVAEPGPGPVGAVVPGRVAVPVLGVTAAAARELLRVARAGDEVLIGAARGAVLAGAAFSARGPAADGSVKPDLAAPATALVPVPGAGAAVVAGTSVAAAHVAAAAARLRRREPGLNPARARARMMGAAAPEGDVGAAGAGVLRAPSGESALRAEPPAARLASARARVAVRVANDGRRTVRLVLRGGRGATVTPSRVVLRPGRPARIVLAATAAPRARLGRVVALAGGRPVLSVPWSRPASTAPPRLGPLTLTRERGRVTGVRFALGRFERGDPARTGTLVEGADRLVLELNGPDATERLTTPGGARGLLPAEYAYAFPRATLRRLAGGRYRVVARAYGARSRRARSARSDRFSP